jgi:hypothetical protein
MTENVIYRYDPDGEPAIRYHAIPSLCAGGASTLGEARSSYRAALAGLLNVTRPELPPVVEHLEGAVAGMWVRTRIGAVHRDPVSDRMFLQILLSPGKPQDELREALRSATHEGSAPVVLIVEPDDTVGCILDQMTPGDGLLITFCDTRDTVSWIEVYGPEASGAEGISHTRDDAELPNMTVDALTRDVVATGGRAVRLPRYSFAIAC